MHSNDTPDTANPYSWYIGSTMLSNDTCSSSRRTFQSSQVQSLFWISSHYNVWYIYPYSCIRVWYPIPLTSHRLTRTKVHRIAAPSGCQTQTSCTAGKAGNYYNSTPKRKRNEGLITNNILPACWHHEDVVARSYEVHEFLQAQGVIEKSHPNQCYFANEQLRWWPFSEKYMLIKFDIHLNIVENEV